LCTNAKFLTNYFAKKYYNADPCIQIKAESSDIGQFLIWDVIEARGQTAEMLHDSALFEFKHVFTIIKHKMDCVEFYHFGTHLNAPHMNQFYINNLDLLDRFVSFFQKSVAQSKSLSKEYLHGFPLNNTANLPALINKMDSKKQDIFLKAISPQNQAKLTNRELEYAYLIIQGMTAKEIAAQLNQSYRTIEHRIEGLKGKLEARNKVDLSSKLKDLLEI
jgi:DNA-binding CsgD family transcriptional regulator